MHVFVAQLCVQIGLNDSVGFGLCRVAIRVELAGNFLLGVREGSVGGKFPSC